MSVNNNTYVIVGYKFDSLEEFENTVFVMLRLMDMQKIQLIEKLMIT